MVWAKNVAYWCECSNSSGNEVCVDILSLIYFSPVVARLTVERANSVKFRGGRSIWDIARHF